MRIISNRWFALANGYTAAQGHSDALVRKWMPRIQLAMEQISPIREANTAKQKRYLQNAMWSLLASLTVILAIAGIPLAAFFFYRYLSLKKVEEMIRHTPNTNLLETWWQALESGAYTAEKTGDTGEIALLQSLKENLPPAWIATRSMLVANKLDIDVLLLGDSAVWNLESKYYSGNISYRNGAWHQDNRHNGLQTLKALDAQWKRETEELRFTLEKRGNRKTAALAKRIEGGLVFTCPRVQLDLASHGPVDCGTIDDWMNRIAAHSKSSPMRTSDQLATLDVLIDHAVSKLNDRSRQSAVTLADSLFQKASAEFELYVSHCEGLLSGIAIPETPATPAPAAPANHAARPDAKNVSAVAPAAPPPGVPPAPRQVFRAFRSNLILTLSMLILAVAMLAVWFFGIQSSIPQPFSPKVCAADATWLYEEPVSSARRVQPLGKKECVAVDGKTSSGWARVAGATSKWIYLPLFSYDRASIAGLPKIKPAN